MDRKDIEARLNAVVDELADLEHARWAHWQKYLHGKCETRSDGSLVIPSELAFHWQRQIDTPFAELSEDEKASDREQVYKYLPTIVDALDS